MKKELAETIRTAATTAATRGAVMDERDWKDDEKDDLEAIKSSIVVVAKCPIPGKSKTRLARLLGEAGAARVAKAMLCDVLTTLSGHVS